MLSETRRMKCPKCKAGKIVHNRICINCGHDIIEMKLNALPIA